MEAISAIVLAGGASRRMGQNKALLAISEQETLIQRVVANLQTLSDDIVLVSNSPELYADLPVRHATDQFAGAGPLAGLHAGLLTVQRRWALLVGCDMPLVDARLVRYMALLTAGMDVVAPRQSDAVEPLHALYATNCLPAIEASLQAGERRMISFLPRVRVRYVEPHELDIFDPARRSFANANTPEDWAKLQKLVASNE
ncbi:MAG: molybdenum cofactor guanylyltransferase [Caldilineales bacterium]